MQKIKPDGLMLPTNHLNFSDLNPLTGERFDRWFAPIGDAYDEATVQRLERAVKIVSKTPHKGVYTWFAGPLSVPLAEVWTAQIQGSDAVGMSTVPEVTLAQFLDLGSAELH